MSVAVAGASEQSFQPFQCLICQSRFTRHENLKRHAALHTRSQDKTSFPCDFCSTTFSRRDLRRRHMRRKHPEQEERRAVKRPRHDPGPAGGPGGCATKAGPRGVEESSVSSAESQYGLLPGQWDTEMNLDVGIGAWRAELPAMTEQRHLERVLQQQQQQHHSPGSTDISDGGPESTNGDDREANIDILTSRQSSLAESTHITGTGRPFPKDATDLLLSMSLGASNLDFGHPAQVPSAVPWQPSSPDTNGDSVIFSQTVLDGLSPRDFPYVQDEWYPSASQIARGLDLYFAHVSYYIPFLHQPTFDAAQTARYLVLSMLCLGYQHGEDPDCGDREGSGESLSLHCFHRARVLVALHEDREDYATEVTAIVQAYLLLEIRAMLYLCGKDSAFGLKVHSKMISLARSGGLTQPRPPGSAATKDLESLWKEFTKAESDKRTLFAVHQVDALWYQFLSIPRSLSHLEIKHELPCPEDCWTASSAAEWAHRQLLARHAAPSVQYTEAVRRFLSSNGDVDSLPAFDPYGAINITQFLLSSAREVSGWSTMTGRLSLDRLEPLRSSLDALAPYTRPQTGTANASTSSCTAEATWEMAMIELQVWSPSHTGGVVEGSIDAVLNESTSLASSCEIMFGAETAQATQPHVDWFLRYLDTALAPDSEAPWVALYAYKAFLIAWQLVCQGVSGAMQVVGVHDGDVEGAISWARKVFRRRGRRRLGKLIMECLDVLDK